MIFRVGIGKQFDLTDWKVIQLGNGRRRVRRHLLKQGAKQNPQVPHEHAETSEHQKFGQLPSRDVALVSSTHGKFFLPQWLVTVPP
jgi:hypothetical protein